MDKPLTRREKHIYFIELKTVMYYTQVATLAQLHFTDLGILLFA